MSDPLVQQLNDAASREFWTRMVQRLGAIGLLGGGLGLGYRGLQGLARVRRETQPTPSDWPAHPSLPVHRPAPFRAKQAADGLGAGFGELGRGVQSAASHIAQPLVDSWKPRGDTTWHPLFFPAAALALGGGMYGGWHLGDAALDQASEATTEDELEKAKQEYELALMGQLQPGRHRALGKVAHNSDPVTELGKQALTGSQGLGGLQGMLLLGGLASGLGAGKLTYDYVRNRQPAMLLEKARKRRIKQLQEQRPVPILMTPPA